MHEFTPISGLIRAFVTSQTQRLRTPPDTTYLVFFQNDFSHRMIRGVRYRKMDVNGSAVLEYCCGLAGDPQARYAVFVRNHLDILPGDLAAPPGFESLQKCLFSRKSPGVRLKSRHSLTVAKCPLLLSKYTLGKPWSSGDRLAYAIDFYNVDADG